MILLVIILVPEAKMTAQAFVKIIEEFRNGYKNIQTCAEGTILRG